MLVVAVFPLVSALFLASLGIVALASGPPRKLWGSFAAFCLLMAGSSACGFLAMTLDVDTTTRLYVIRGAAALASMAAFYGVYYAYVLTGEDARAPIRRHARTHNPKRMLLATVIYSLVLPPVLILTDWFMAKLALRADGSFQLIHGPVGFVVALIVLGSLAKIIHLLHWAYKNSEDPPYRTFLKMNSRAFRAILGPGFILLILLPMFGYHTQPLAFVFYPIAVTIFYLAIVRYQIARVQALNEELEAKVRRRTLALEQAQARLVQSQKMASLGELVAGVAHEMNSPLGALRSIRQSMGTANERLRTAVEKDAPELFEARRIKAAFRVLGEAERVLDDGTERLDDIVSRLRAFARLDEADLKDADLKEGLEATLALLAPRFERAEITVERDYDELPPLRCKPAQLNQVFMNLLSNAIEAIEARRAAAKGGADDCETAPGRLRIALRLVDGGAEVTIADNGVGIPAEERERIFDPGYTKKGVGVGTGLGLAICHQIVESDHKGAIRVDDAQDGGAVFTIGLPLAAV